MPLSPGDILSGHYRIETEIGRGAYGRVYRAVDTKLDRPVAIKELTKGADGLASTLFSDYVRRFEREARVQAGFNHPNIVQVYELIEEDDEQRYLVMELVDGESLAKSLARRGPLPVDEAVRITRDILAGLAVVHADPRDIVHRDIKPSNVLLTKGGQAKLADFGLAQVGDESRRSGAGQPHPGTALYMSPEQETTNAYLYPASDLFSVGCVLFEMLTGVPYKRAKKERKGLADLRPDAPPWLVELTARALAKDPDDRPANAAEMARVLAQSFAQRSTNAATTPLPPQRNDVPAPVQTPLHRHWLRPAVGVGVVALLVVLLVTVFRPLVDGSQQSPAPIIALSSTAPVMTVTLATPTAGTRVLAFAPAPSVALASAPAATDTVTVPPTVATSTNGAVAAFPPTPTLEPTVIPTPTLKPTTIPPTLPLEPTVIPAPTLKPTTIPPTPTLEPTAIPPTPTLKPTAIPPPTATLEPTMILTLRPTSTPVSYPANMLVEENTNRAHGDYRDFEVGRATDCAQACDADARCIAWTFRKVGTYCWLKDNLLSSTYETIYTSGVKLAGAVFQFENDTNRGGGDYRDFAVPDAQPIKCALACAEEAQCRAWTYRKVSPYCWLKNTIPSANRDGYYVSGVK